jgi:outer membrane protein OmpA-like peptidoglycan-associated protein
MNMKPARSSWVVIAAASLLTGCAASPELVSCLDPNRRVAVELTGYKVKPAPKPKEGEKPGKPGRQNVTMTVQIQGSTAWDVGSAVLKKEGQAELDAMVKEVNSGAGKDTRPTNVEVVIVTGHNDRLEERSHAGLSEQRAKVVTDYLVSKGISSKVIFWEGRGSRDPVAVTKFCDA